jgi:toxin ParE1/3/4
MNIRWTPAAKADLRYVRSHIARDSIAYAARVVARIRSAVDMLRQFPEMGGVVEEWEQGNARELIVGNYRVIYRLKGNTVEILLVLHAARRLPPDLN